MTKLSIEDRCTLLSLTLGDGSISSGIRERKIPVKTTSQRRPPSLWASIYLGHSHDQIDYLKWKSSMVNAILERTTQIGCRSSIKGQYPNARPFYQYQARDNRLLQLRRILYKNGKKDATRALKYITNPVFAMAIWLMDDGTVQSHNNTTTANLRLYTCSYDMKQQRRIANWINKQFKMNVTIGTCKSSKSKTYYFIVFSKADSVRMWRLIRPIAMRMNSMAIKFHKMEACLIHDCAKRNKPIPDHSNTFEYPTVSSWAY